MTSITDTLCAIERRAERALVQELRHMTQNILDLRSHLTLDERAHADALLLKLDHLERAQSVACIAPAVRSKVSPQASDASPLRIVTLQPCGPSHFLVHFYSHDAGDLESVQLTDTLFAAAQLVREHLAKRHQHVVHLTQRASDGRLSFFTGDDLVLASVEPCEPRTPDIEPAVVEACTELACGNLGALQRLMQATTALEPALLAA